MVDMFVRLGQLEDAFEFISKMEFEPNEIIWPIFGCNQRQGPFFSHSQSRENSKFMQVKSASELQTHYY